MNTFLNFSRARWAPSMAVRKSLAAVTLLGLVAGCSVLPKPPSRVDIFDFGPGLTKTAEASQPATPLPPIALADFTSAGVPDGRSALFYRLAYSNAQMLYPYTQARWSQPPTTLMQLAVRDRLGVRRSVIYGDQNIDQQIKGGQSPTVLRAEVSARMQPGVVYTTFHFPESGANVITTDNSDWATNCPEYKVTAVQVMPVMQPSAWQKEHQRFDQVQQALLAARTAGVAQAS